MTKLSEDLKDIIKGAVIEFISDTIEMAGDENEIYHMESYMTVSAYIAMMTSDHDDGSFYCNYIDKYVTAEFAEQNNVTDEDIVDDTKLHNAFLEFYDMAVAYADEVFEQHGYKV